MGGGTTDQVDLVLASKWDVPLALIGLTRVAFLSLPAWAKITILSVAGLMGAWTALTWLRDRGKAS
ncbi:hypothetical protein ACIRP0_08735 [Streptomyces sp. NPDC101733]|uniref:hypothetical protein n=1 Tax=unclassified Streptomyces TaxID=2593676 RepID=UPI0037FC64EC